jgi:hypothetical protein
MKLEEAKQTFYDASETLSENTRKLCLAGIAIIWILKVADKTAAGIPFKPVLFAPLIFFVVALIFDAIQYLYKTIAWWWYHRIKHQEGVAEDDEVEDPRYISLPTWFLFAGKLITCVIGYAQLLPYMWNALQHSAGR